MTKSHLSLEMHQNIKIVIELWHNLRKGKDFQAMVLFFRHSWVTHTILYSAVLLYTTSICSFLFTASFVTTEAVGKE